MKKSKKIIIYFDTKLNYGMHILFGNMIHKYLLEHNICKNKKIFYEIDKNILENTDTDSIILPIYGIYKKNIVDLDNKISFYNYLNKNKLFLTKIKLIPTYINSKCKNDKKKYIIKHKYGTGSSKNIIVKDYLHNLMEKYDFDNYQIQDYIKYNYVYGIECSCINGKIICVLTYEVKSIEKYTDKMKNILNNYIKFDEIVIFIENIINQVNYNGFIEFEFLITNNDIYIMECNPRISGLIICEEYFNSIIKKYIQYKSKKNLFLTNETNKTSYPLKVNLDFVKMHYIPKTYLSLFYNIIKEYID